MTSEKPGPWKAREPSDAERNVVEEGLRKAGFADLPTFLIAHTGKGLTEQAEVLGVPSQAFIAVHNFWIAETAPSPI